MIPINLKLSNKLFLVILFVLGVTKTKASSFSLPIQHSDTTSPLNKSYKINEKVFMNNYGKDDTSRALISYFFNKRIKASKMIYIPLSIVALTGIVFSIAGIFATVPFGYPLALLLFALVATTITLSIIGGIYLIKYSRKKLFRLVDKYNSGGYIPKKIRAKSYFKKLLIQYKN